MVASLNVLKIELLLHNANNMLRLCQGNEPVLDGLHHLNPVRKDRKRKKGRWNFDGSINMPALLKRRVRGSAQPKTPDDP